MPSKKKETAPETPTEPEEVAVETVEAPAPEEPKKARLATCGHVDMHSFGPDGKHDHPACVLPAGHTGDHYAKHQQKVERERFYERETGKLLKIEYDTLEVDAWWGDAAGVPTNEIQVGKMPSRNQKSDLLQEIQKLMQG
jgi:hypothetical protein